MLPLVTNSLQTETIITQMVTKLLTTPKNASFIMKSFICIGEQNHLQWIKDVNVGKPPDGGGRGGGLLSILLCFLPWRMQEERK